MEQNGTKRNGIKSLPLLRTPRGRTKRGGSRLGCSGGSSVVPCEGGEPRIPGPGCATRPTKASRCHAGPVRTSERRANRGHGGPVFSLAGRSKRGQTGPNGARVHPPSVPVLGTNLGSLPPVPVIPAKAGIQVSMRVKRKSPAARRSSKERSPTNLASPAPSPPSTRGMSGDERK